VNWYQFVEKWHFEWLMEDIQELFDCNCKTHEQQTDDTIKASILIQELKQRLRKEKRNFQLTKIAADIFFKH
jgi:hypothetical protein